MLACKTVAFCCTMYYQSGKGNLVLYLLINLTTVINETKEELTEHLPIIKRSFYCVFAIHGLECQSFNNIFVCLLKFYNKLLILYLFISFECAKTQKMSPINFTLIICNSNSHCPISYGPKHARYVCISIVHDFYYFNALS